MQSTKRKNSANYEILKITNVKSKKSDRFSFSMIKKTSINVLDGGILIVMILI